MADVHSTGASSTYGRALAQTRPGSPSPIPPLPFPQRASSWSSTPESPRRLKVTGWRLLNTGVILRLGIYKAVATYFGQTTAPSTLDWVIGVVWTLISYWVGFIEQDHPTYAEWFFQEDLSDGLWKGPVAILVLFAAGGGFWAAKFVGREEDRLVIALLKILGVYFGAAMMLVALSGLVFIVLALLWSEFANFFDRPPAVRRSNWSPNRPLIIFIYFILVILWIIIMFVLDGLGRVRWTHWLGTDDGVLFATCLLTAVVAAVLPPFIVLGLGRTVLRVRVDFSRLIVQGSGAQSAGFVPYSERTGQIQVFQVAKREEKDGREENI